jgi:membrane protease YdiL (CAAX protease family)
MKRIVAFARSVIPQDPTQLFLLAGSVLLLICIELRSYPETPEFLQPSIYNFLDVYRSWLLFSAAARLLIFLAGAAGLFISFWPGVHAARRIFCFVLLPSFTGIAAICGRYLYISQLPDFPRESVMKAGPHNEAWAFNTVWSLGPAVHMSVLGFVLVLIFFSRLATGVSRLPVSLAHDKSVPFDDAEIWERVLIVVLISTTCIRSIAFVIRSVFESVYYLVIKHGNYRLPPLGNPVIVTILTASLAGIAAWAAGERRWKELRQFLRPPGAKFGLLGLSFPTAIEFVPNLIVYVSDRIHWATFDFGKVDAPIFSTYFSTLNPLFLWWLIPPALEEVMWRGYLQPRFVQRFGVMRGIFLLGISWSAFHFLGDVAGMSEDSAIFLQFAFRLTSCVAMSYVLGWLTLRSGSVWPAALAHGFSNVWILTNSYNPNGIHNVVPEGFIVTACWAVLGFVLFRYWPPSISAEDSDPVAEIAPA